MAPSANVNVPVAAPTATGEKVTPTVQVFPAGTLAPQVLLATANGPLGAILVIPSAVARWLVKVTVLAALVLPATVVLKLRLVTDSVTGALPVPDKLTVWGVVTALSAIVKVPVAAPTATGEKVTPTVQVFPAKMLAPQVLLATVNVPLAPMLVKLSALA
jgi:hypothetical protein